MRRCIIKSVLLFLYVTHYCVPTLAQEQRRGDMLDSLYNDPFLFPAVSSVLLPAGFFEVNNFSTILSATAGFDESRKSYDLNGRYSFFVNAFQITYGLSKKGNFNIGADIGYQSYRFDEDIRSSPLKVFGGSPALIRDKYLSSAALRFRWKPISRQRNLIIQGSFLQPIHNMSEAQTTLSAKAIYVYQMSRMLFMYGQAGLSYTFRKKEINANMGTALSLIFQYQIWPVFGIVGTIAYTPSFGKDSKSNFSQTSFGVQPGIGFQYQPTLRLGVNTSYAYYALGKNIGKFHLLNLGLRVII